MSHYTFICQDGEIAVAEPEAGDVRSEAEAIECANALAQNHHRVELWQGQRLVQRFIDGKID